MSIETNTPSVQPILFINPMACATWAGWKTHTRRVFQLPRGMVWYDDLGGEKEGWFCDEGGSGWWHVSEIACPYGQPGDLLYVKEGWRAPRALDALPGSALPHNVPLWYPADGSKAFITNAGEPGRLRSARFMPRRCSRMTLGIKATRVERLQEISETDAKAEGVRPSYITPPPGEFTPFKCGTWSQGFEDLWNSINAARGYGWDTNPWVHVIEFDAIRKNVDDVLREAA